MCGLFGFVHYGENEFKNLSALTKTLAEYAAVRGTDATGIAYVKNGIQIQKEARSAYTMSFKHPDNLKTLIGHTRHATHGSASKNYNNHPFFGKAGNTRFALAHNGVLMNYSLNLPKTKIETDSYLAVQLIEKQKKFSFDSIRFMAETVQGSFSFAILDDQNSIWLVKGDNPLSVLHFPEKKMYVYASTDEILYKAVVDSMLFADLKRGHFSEVPIDDGTILKINPDGTLEKETFHFSESVGLPWWEFGGYPVKNIRTDEIEYLDTLRTMAWYHGIEADEIDALIEEGFTPEEVEEYLYEI